MFCGNCGDYVANTQRFCASCGAPASNAHLQQQASPPNARCISCGHNLDRASAFCGHCGVRTQVVNNTGTPAVRPWRFENKRLLRILGALSLFFSPIISIQWLLWVEEAAQRRYAGFSPLVDRAVSDALPGIILFFVVFVVLGLFSIAASLEGKNPGEVSAGVSLICGLLSVTIVAGIIGIIQASKAREEGYKGIMLTAGKVLSWLGICLSILVLLSNLLLPVLFRLGI